MKLECDTCYFYPSGLYTTSRRRDSHLKCNDNDIKEYSQLIRIFGTREQIDKALDDYIELTGLNLDEVYDYENEKMLKVYKEKYDKMNNNKALITTI